MDSWYFRFWPDGGFKKLSTNAITKTKACDKLALKKTSRSQEVSRKSRLNDKHPAITHKAGVNLGKQRNTTFSIKYPSYKSNWVDYKAYLIKILKLAIKESPSGICY